MKNFKSLLCAISIVMCSSSVFAQISVNSIDVLKPKEPKFINDIVFTPLGTTEIESQPVSRTLEIKEMIITAPDLSEKLSVASPEIIEHCSGMQFKYAMMLNISVEKIKITNVYNYIEEWFGTRYRMGGTTKAGIDCSAFTGGLLKGCYDLVVPRTAREQHRAATPVSREELSEGDLVFFNTTGGVSHVGVYLENNYFVHSSSSQGVTISNLNDSYYAKRYISGGRILPVSPEATAKN